MKFSKKDTLVVYIAQNKVTFYSKSFDNEVIIDLTDDVISNLELLDKDKLKNIILTGINFSELNLTSVALLIDSNITFSKEIENIAISLQYIEAEKFLDIVPLHHIISKTFHMKDRSVVIAADSDLCKELVGIFEDEIKIPVIGIVPLSILKELAPKLKKNISVNEILEKIDFIKKYSLINTLQHNDKLLKQSAQSHYKIMLVAIVMFGIIIAFSIGLFLFLR